MCTAHVVTQSLEDYLSMGDTVMKLKLIPPIEEDETNMGGLSDHLTKATLITLKRWPSYHGPAQPHGHGTVFIPHPPCFYCYRKGQLPRGLSEWKGFFSAPKE